MELSKQNKKIDDDNDDDEGCVVDILLDLPNIYIYYCIYYDDNMMMDYNIIIDNTYPFIFSVL